MSRPREFKRPARRLASSPPSQPSLEEESKGDSLKLLRARYDELKQSDQRLKSDIAQLRGRKSENIRKISRLRETQEKLNRDFYRAQEMLGLSGYTNSRHLPQELMAMLSGMQCN